jgi:Rv2632c-like
MSGARVWNVTIAFTEDDEKTRADAVLEAGQLELRGWGRARRNPVDPDVPAVGEEVAAARALSELAHHLLDQAAHTIETWERRPVHLDH